MLLLQMFRVICFTIAALLVTTIQPVAQESGRFWLQIEARPSLELAQERLREFSSELPDIHGFDTPTRWFIIAMGPYSRAEASQLRAKYLRSGQIPDDAFVTDGVSFGEEIWPTRRGYDAGLTQRPGQPPAPAPAATPDQAPVLDTSPPKPPVVPDETVTEARQSEAALSWEERARLQKMLQWAGVYTGPLDAVFGEATRVAMATWQRQTGILPTGVLTTEQRAKLRTAYNAILEDLDLQSLEHTAAGIKTLIPTALVSEGETKFPFVRYKQSTDFPADLLLISQKGNQQTLGGLFTLMQSLEFIPQSGPRELRRDGFTIIGEGPDSIVHTRAWLKGETIKGYTLIWPRDDEDRRTRLIDEIEANFTVTDGVLEPPETQGTKIYDLGNNLEPDTPLRSRSGVYVGKQGQVLTVADAVNECSRVSANGVDAELLLVDEDQGLALISPRAALVPEQIAEFRDITPEGNEIAVAGYSFGGVLNAPTMSFGQLDEREVRDGNPDTLRIWVKVNNSDAGGPVMDEKGRILAILSTIADPSRDSPAESAEAIPAQGIRAFLSKTDLGSTEQASDNPADKKLSREALTRLGRTLTTLVECWR